VLVAVAAIWPELRALRYRWRDWRSLRPTPRHERAAHDANLRVVQKKMRDLGGEDGIRTESAGVPRNIFGNSP
jgi:hypothetical protein